VLTYVEGDAGSLGFPPPLLYERGIRALGRFIRTFHDAAAAFGRPMMPCIGLAQVAQIG
jgi:hypothetical protein